MIRRSLLLGLAGLIAAASLPPAAAQSLESLKSQGLVGEKPDGLLGVVKSGGNASAVVSQVNARRMAEYKAIAEKNGTSLDAVQAIAGKRLILAAPDGTYVMDGAGDWRRK